jgi:hypothetical protein
MYDADMRTTFTPAPDIADRLRELARTSKRSLNVVVNELLRKALTGEAVREATRPPYQVQTFELKFKPGLDPEKPSQILADLDVEEFLDRS